MKYAQVFVADFIFGGMENTTATSLIDSVLIDVSATSSAT
ncbi:MAG: M1 family metallopeptidase [Myxococcales bacterium]|nr:M1 family metallopeptidase [Myxococcales bacterium]